MREGWRKATLRELVSESNERAGARTDLPVLSVTKNRGVMLASERFGKPLHGRNLAKYRLARRGQLAVDPMLLWDGSLGLQRSVDAGLVSPDYRVFDAAAGVDPNFLEALLRSDAMRPHFQSGARGTNIRRNRIARGDFLAIETALPPLHEQRRIAALLAAVDLMNERENQVLRCLLATKDQVASTLIGEGEPSPRMEIGDLVTSCDYGISTSLGSDSSGIVVLRMGNLSDGEVDLTELKYASREAVARRCTVQPYQQRRTRRQGRDLSWTQSSRLVRLLPAPPAPSSGNGGWSLAGTCSEYAPRPE